MANEECLRILRQGSAAWNRWRGPGSYIAVDLSGANLEKTDLRGANLEAANLEEARLSGADLQGAVLSGANMAHANLRGDRKSVV